MAKLKKTTKLAKKKEPQEISLPKIINSEVNLLVFPFFALSTKGLKKKLETEYRGVVKRGDQKIEILWNVSANPKHGYPCIFDRNIHKVIEQIMTEILRKNGKIENPLVLGSLYNLCKRMNIRKFGGMQYKKIKEALERIGATRIKSEGTFYQKGKKQWVSKSFGLYDGVVFKGEQLEDGAIADTNFLYLSDIYLQSL
ncbi:MAG: replication initiator protein A, partial [Candidatus Aerophobetes bacterium]|nr:replication initiator protein A [Candidatus Aerophobetes bacterium]